MYKILMALSAGAFLLSSCGDTKESGMEETGNVEDTGCWIETTSDLVGATADNSSAAEWYYAIACDGWCGGGDVTIMQSGVDQPWGPEKHDMVQGEYDPCGTWDNWEVTLPTVTTPGEQVDGQTTLFKGNDSARMDTLTFKFTAYDTAGDFLECWVWGADISYFSADGCEDATNY